MILATVKWVLRKTFLFKHVASVYDYLFLAFNTLKTIRSIRRQSSESSVFFFFPFYHLGGAEKVHLDIVKCAANRKPVVFFTLPSATNALEAEFNKHAACFYIYPYIRRNNFWSQLLLKAIMRCVNRAPNALAFSSNCRLFYELLPKFGSNVTCVDLIHAFVHEHEPGAEKWSLPYVQRLNTRIVINHKTQHDLYNQYDLNSVNAALKQRINLIKNAVNLPAAMPAKNYNGKVHMVYVGRNGIEKRIPAIGTVGAVLNKLLGVETTMIGGDLQSSVHAADAPLLNFAGEINDEAALYELYAAAHILILLSSREGFPVTIMEAMANGCAVVSTDVGGIPFEIKDGIHGRLLANGPEEELVKEAVKAVEDLCNDRRKLETICRSNYEYACNNFSKNYFIAQYKALFA